MTGSSRIVNFHSKVSGVTYQDPESGRNRQDIIHKHARVGQSLVLIPEPDNPHSKHAVGVWLKRWRRRYHIGYVRSRKGADREVAQAIQAGQIVKAKVTAITGGRGGKYYGLNIKIKILPGRSVAEGEVAPAHRPEALEGIVLPPLAKLAVIIVVAGIVMPLLLGCAIMLMGLVSGGTATLLVM